MANKVTIDIEAKFVDNASAGIDALSAKVDALNGKKVTISSSDVGSVVTVGDKMTKSAEATAKQALNTIQSYQKGQSIAERTVSIATKAAEQTQKMLNVTVPKSAEIKSYANSSNTTIALPETSTATNYTSSKPEGYSSNVNRNQADLMDVIERSFSGSTSSASECGEKIVNDIQDGFTKGVNRHQADLMDVIERSIDNMFKMHEPSEYAVSPNDYSYINPNAASTASDMLRAGKSTVDDGSGGRYSKDAYEYVYSGIHGSELNEIISATETKSKETASAVGEAVSKKIKDASSTSSQFDVETFASVLGNATGNSKYVTMAKRLANIFEEPDSKNMRMLKGLATSVGTMQTIQGVTGGVSDIIDGINADNAYDSAKGKWRGGVTLGLTGIGGLLGSFVGMPMVGAGIGSSVASIFGDSIADTLSGMKKSWKELTEDAINKYFGIVSLSNAQIAYMANSISGETTIRENNGFSTSLSNASNYRTSLQSSADNLKILGSRIEIFDNMRLPNSESDLTSFTSAVKSYGETGINYLSTQLFNELAAADDLLGSGSSLVEPISEKYTEAIKQIQDIQDKAVKYIDKAMKDNELSTPEMVKINGFKDQIQEIINGYTTDPSSDQIEGMKFLAAQGSMSKDSFDGVLKTLSSNFGNLQIQAATEAAVLMRSGKSREEAMELYYGKFSPELDNYASNATGFAQNFMINDLSYDRRTTSEAFGSIVSDWTKEFALDSESGTYHGLNMLRNTISSSDVLRDALGINKSKYGAGINYESQAAYSTLYDSLNNSNLIKTLENSANAGQATQTQMNSLMSLYEIGAYGGNEHAMQGYFGMKMAQSEQTRSWMDALIQNQPDSVPNAIKDAYNWALGRVPNLNTLDQPPASEQTPLTSEQITPISEQTDPMVSDEQNKKFVQKDIVSDFNEMEKVVPKTSEQTGQIDTSNLAQNIMDSLNSSFQNMSASDFGKMPIGQTIMSGIGDSLTDMSTEQFEQLDIGKDIMNSINSSFQNIDASQMGELDIGKTVIDKIGDSMTNMSAGAFGDLNIGQNVMDILNTQLSNFDISGIDFNIGESLMSKINEGLTSIDTNGEFMSNLNIGETVINSINLSLASVNVDSIDFSGIGANVSSSLINSFSNIDVSGAGEIITSQISASLSSISVEPTINITPLYQIVDNGAGLQEQLMSAISAASVGATVTVNITYGIEASIPDSYTPQDKTATVIYGLDSSAVDGWQPPNKTATVTYNIVTLGSLPHFASGTDYMPYNSMATINDQASAANPQELVVHDGRGYLFDGRNVQVPLSQGDRVFTASQTQKMLHGNYAGGYDNLGYGQGDYVQDYFNQYLNGDKDNTPQLDYGSGATISTGGASVAIGNVEFKVENKGDGRDVVETIKDNCDEVAETLASVIEKRLGDEFRNTPTRI